MLRVLDYLPSVFHCGHATGDGFDLEVAIFCTVSSEPESSFKTSLKVGRMKSWRSPPVLNIFARDKSCVEIPSSFPSSKNISSCMREKKIFATSEL